MNRVWPVLAALLGPGVSQALVGRRRAAGILLAAFVAAMAGMGFTIYAMPIAVGVVLAGLVDIIVYVARQKAPIVRHQAPAMVAWGIAFVSAALARGFVAEAFKLPSSAMEPTFRIGDHIFVSKLQRSPSRGDVIVFHQPCQPERQYIKRVIAFANDTVEIRCGVLYVNHRAVPSELVKAEDVYSDRNEMEGDWYTRSVSRYRETLGDKTFDVFYNAEKPTRTGVDHKDFPSELANCNNQRDYESKPSTEQAPGKIVDGPPPSDPCTPHRHYVVPAGHVFTMGDNRDNSNDSRYWGSVPTGHIIGTVTGRWLPVGRFGTID